MFINFPDSGVVVQGLDQVRLPKMYRILQKYDKQKIWDIRAHVQAQLEENIQNKDWFCNKKIAITASSRGIPHIDCILKTLCEMLASWGAHPFIVPAMGSHGGATAEGQRELLKGYGITEENVGAPIISSMEVVQYGAIEGIPLFCDKNAFYADGIVLLNKVKPHTDFRGTVESGLCKMIAIGLAKHKGATAFHSLGYERFAEIIPKAAKQFLQVAPVVFGVGIIQNAYDEVCKIDVIKKEHIIEKDMELLAIAKGKIATFKFKELDVLIIDEIGKNISGFGYDPNIVGRSNSDSKEFSDILKLKRLFIRGLTDETHHNGCGIGAADVTTARCLRSIDWDVLWTNIITSTQLHGGRIPIYMNSDLDAIKLAIHTCNGIECKDIKLARIKNTLCMDKIEVSQALYEQIKDHPDVKYIEGPFDFLFDQHGDILEQYNKRLL